eukprot:TRINITY_DN17177_c0_g1_i1.p1 TRINITY_DN17177_c0_g1~~TRINITY_DN17177_c0_g1_i1.p1  ORF type:complete len:469 (+),score=99.99 TRINITY_DN17177_c0_g1_i1:52-1407(+)
MPVSRRGRGPDDVPIPVSSSGSWAQHLANQGVNLDDTSVDWANAVPTAGSSFPFQVPRTAPLTPDEVALQQLQAMNAQAGFIYTFPMPEDLPVPPRLARRTPPAPSATRSPARRRSQQDRDQLPHTSLGDLLPTASEQSRRERELRRRRIAAKRRVAGSADTQCPQLPDASSGSTATSVPRTARAQRESVRRNAASRAPAAPESVPANRSRDAEPARAAGPPPRPEQPHARGGAAAPAAAPTSSQPARNSARLAELIAAQVAAEEEAALMLAAGVVEDEVRRGAQAPTPAAASPPTAAAAPDSPPRPAPEAAPARAEQPATRTPARAQRGVAAAVTPPFATGGADGAAQGGDWQISDFSYENLLELGSMAVSTGLPKAQLALFKPHSYTARVAGQEEECTICLEALDEGDEALRIACQHVFHHKCIIEWLAKTNRCPTCRFEVPRKGRLAP